MPLILVEEDRLEDLAAACFLRLDQEQSEAPFLQETTVIVSGANQGRWFQLHQARSRGISSGLQLPFPWKFVEEELVRSGFLMREGRIDRDWIFARIFACLLDGSISTELGIPYPVDSIAGDEGGSALEIRALQLAERIADLYDKYFLHRPEWVEAWLQGENLPPSWSRYRWQVQLLRRVLQGEADTGVRIAGLALHNCLAQGKWLPSGEDTEPLHIFALVNLAPNILRFFLLQAQTRQVIFYHQRRSSAFLGELPRKGISSMAEQGGASPAIGGAAAWNNGLLVANGQKTARFQSLLLSLDVPLGDQPEGPEAVAETDLANLQKALRDNRPTPSLNGDGSISIHSCHSAIREVEVLQQQLLLLLEQEPGLVAEDILVLCPEMERYAELIDSVFSIGTQVNQAGRVVKIPYSGVAMTGSLVGEAVQFLESLMGFVLGKQSLSELGDLLGREPVLHSIDLELSELRDLLDLLYTTGVRRGSGFSLTPGPAGGAAAPYTLASGLERIYLGQSFPDSILSRGAPFSLDVREAEVMGLLLQKIEPLLQLAEEAKNARQPPGNWQERLLEAARPLLGGSREAGILLQINSLLNDTAFMAAPPVRFRTYAQRLNSRLDGVTQGRGVFRRGVSFCRLQEGRGLPAKVLVLLGMNEGSLPRKPFYCDYDLMARQSGDEGLYRRREVNLLGDPSMRDEDRQAFLESLMDAGERLIILYTGQSELTNEELPPAVVVTDLIQESATLKPLKHPLHEWSFSNFDRPQPAPLESPEPIHFDARLLRRSDAAPAGFLDSSPEAAAVLSTGEAVSVRQLHRFLKDPAQDYLRRQHDLEVTSGDEEADWEDRLPLSPDGLESWKLRERFVSLWLEAWEAGIVPEERPAMIRQRFLDEQLLPPGALGAALWSKRIAETAQRLQTHLSGEDLRVVPVTTVYASGTVTSEVLVDSSNRRILPLNGAITSANWLLHVFLNLNGVGGQYCLLPLEKGNVCHWKVDDPFLENYRKWMSGILDLYRKNGDRLLPFSPNVAHAFAQARAKDPEEDESWQLETAVSKQWAPRYGTGDLSPAMLLCYGSGVAAVSTEDNGQATRELARQIFGLPLEWLDSLEGSDA